MSEQFPNQDLIDLAWEAAQASNKAFDAVKITKADFQPIEHMEDLRIDGIRYVNPEALDILRQNRQAASSNFVSLLNIAGPVMRLKNSPFANSSYETESVELQEIDDETLAELDTIPFPEYRKEVVCNYRAKRVAVERQIKDGKLDAKYRLPELGAMLERVKSLALTYEVMDKKSWDPEVVFVPKGLSLEQWNGLLTGHSISGTDNDGSNGVYRTWDGSEVVDPVADETDSADLWDVAIVSGSDRPVLTSVSKDGKNGSNAKKVVKTFGELPTVYDVTLPAAVIKTISPTEDTYFATQLARLERGEKPLDWDTWTIGKEDVNVDVSVESVFLRFYPSYSQVRSDWNSRDDCYDHAGVRPSVRGDDLGFSLQS